MKTSSFVAFGAATSFFLGGITGCGQGTTVGTGSQRNAQALSQPTTPRTILAFETMYGVDGPFIGKKNAIRGVAGDELPWEIESAIGSLTTDGHLRIQVTGLVFADVPEVPPELRGINDETEFRALVSCLAPDPKSKKERKISVVNLVTEGFPATPSGDATIDTFVALPGDCVAPIIFVLAGSEDLWFAVTGAETD